MFATYCLIFICSFNQVISWPTFFSKNITAIQLETTEFPSCLYLLGELLKRSNENGAESFHEFPQEGATYVCKY